MISGLDSCGKSKMELTQFVAIPYLYSVRGDFLLLALPLLAAKADAAHRAAFGVAVLDALSRVSGPRAPEPRLAVHAPAR